MYYTINTKEEIIAFIERCLKSAEKRGEDATSDTAYDRACGAVNELESILEELRK